MKPFARLLIAVFFFLPALQSQAADPQTIPENPNTAAIQHSIESLNRGDTRAVEQTIAQNYKYYSPSNAATPVPGKAMLAQLNAALAAFPDLRWQIEAMYAADDWVVTRFVVRGTHKGNFQGIPATGNTIEYSSIVICHFKDGKIIEEREELNLLGLMRQLNLELRPKQN